MKRDRKKKLGTLCLLAALMILLAGIQAFGTEKNGSIQITLKDLGKANSDRSGVKLRLYQVGTVDENGQPQIDSSYGIRDYPQTGKKLDAAARKIAKAIQGDPLKSRKTNGKGVAVFSELSSGIYLIMAEEKNGYGAITPFLVQLPYYEEVNGTLTGPVYEVSAQPKATPPETESETNGTPTETETTEKTTETSTGKNGTPGKPPANPATGDTANIGEFLTLAVLALFVMGVVITIRRKRA